MPSTRTGSPRPTPTPSRPPNGLPKRTGSTTSAWSPAVAATVATCRVFLLGRDHPFNALLIHAPVYNMYSQMAADFAVHSTRFGHFWESPEIYREISPHYYAGDFDTPALDCPRPAGPARAGRSGVRTVPYATKQRHRITPDLLPGRKSLGSQAEQFSLLVPRKSATG